MLYREHLARAAESALDFVDDEEDVVLVADLADFSEVAWRRRDVSSFAEDGLDEDSCCVARGCFSFKKKLELENGIHAAVLERVFPVRVSGDGALFAVGEGDGEDAWHERSVVLAVDGLGAGHGHGAECAAVVGALHDDDILLLGCVAGELDGCFDGFGARVPEEERVEGFVWHEWEEGVDEVEIGLLEGDVDLAVDEFADLGLCGFCHAGMTVA